MIFDRAHRHRIVATAQRLFRRTFGFDASGSGDRWPVSSQLWSPVSQGLAAAGPISIRAGWLVQNSPTAASLLECWVDNLCPTAPTIRSGHPDDEIRTKIEKAWNRFTKRCDAEGAGDLGGFLAKLVRTLVTTGDGFCHLITEDGRLQLRLISTEQVWRPYTQILPNGRRIFSGVELTEGGRHIAFWVLPQQPDLPWAVYPLPQRIDASDMTHVFVSPFPGGVRGLSWFTPVASRLLELDRLEDAALARANTAALFCGFVRDIDNTSGIASDLHLSERDGKPTLSMEPGELRRLPPGCDITFPANIPDLQGLGDFLKHMLRSVASGGGVPHSLLTGDLSDVNYSSARMGLEQFKRACTRIQQSHLVAQLLQPIFERFVTLEILSGRIDAPDFEENSEEYLASDWRFPAWASLDPAKDAAADIELLNAKLRSRSEIIAARGRDIEDVDREIAADPFKDQQVQQPAQPQQPQKESEDA
jgi:lambda family phage portal protein